MTQHLRPISTITAGAWTAIATTLHGDTDEGIDSPDDDTTYAETSTASSDMELRLAVGADPGTGLSHTIQWRARRHGVWFLSAELAVSLYEGATLRATAPSTFFGDFYTTESYTLTEAEANAITDYSNLRLRFQLVLDMGTAHVHITACELDIPSTEVHAARRGGFIAPTVLGQVVASRAKGAVSGYC